MLGLRAVMAEAGERQSEVNDKDNVPEMRKRDA
jgi:hypothetical protein